MSLTEEKPKNTKRVDAYICPDLHIIITKVLANEGNVPAVISCLQCGQGARSQGFNVNQNLSHVVEWYKPSDEDFKVLSLKMETPEYNRLKEFVIKGGLLSRPVPPQTKKDGE